MAEYDYSNTQVQVPGEIREKILQLGPKLVKKSDLAKTEKGYEDDPHISVLYGIHSSYPSLELVDLIESYPKFTVRLGAISLFKSIETGKPFDVVKIDVESPDLHVLNAAIRDCCEHTSEFPNYKPHVTLAYTNPNCYFHLENNPIFRGLAFVADNVLFSSKNGDKRRIFLGQK